MAFSWTNPLGALPPIPSHPVAPSDLSSTISNYTTFAAAEDQADRLLELFGSPAHEDDQKVVTLLRTFRRYLPKEGQRALNTDIIAISRDDVKLRDLARHIREAVLKPMKVAGGQQPQSLITPPTYAQAAADITASMSSLLPSSRLDQANLKRTCLRRDGYRCVYSGAYDRKAKKELPDLPRDAVLTKTECAHILPFSLSKFDSRSALETQNKAVIWCALYRYFPALKGKIGTESINQPSNAFTLGSTLHADFGEYHVYFSPKNDLENTYTMTSIEGYQLLSATRVPGLNGDVMELQSHDPTTPLPDPEFLKVHARISQILECVKCHSCL
ncbi:hypothetical protein FALCPG4_009113 [Fusarium falciforme]